MCNEAVTELPSKRSDRAGFGPVARGFAAAVALVVAVSGGIATPAFAESASLTDGETAAEQAAAPEAVASATESSESLGLLSAKGLDEALAAQTSAQPGFEGVEFSAAHAFDNSLLVRVARSYPTGSYQGYCKIFANNVVNAALAQAGVGARVGGYGTPGGIYYGAYQRVGGSLVGMNDAIPGDLIQTIRADQRYSDHPSDYGLHTAIVVSRIGPGNYMVRDSNWGTAGTVSEHAWNLHSHNSRYGTAAYVWRFGSLPLKSLTSTPTPNVSGEAKLGATLSAAVGGTWQPLPVTVNYQWLRDGMVIPGANKASYTVGRSDQGRTLTVRTTGAKSGYASVSKVSNGIAIPSVLNGVQVDRHAGSDRFFTAVALSKAEFKEASEVKTVIVANGLGFADALSAAPLGAKLGAPLLLTAPDRVSTSTLDEIKRLHPKEILVVGGEGAVSALAEKQLASIAPVIRLQGKDRYETSLAIAERGWNKTVDSAFVATGSGFADALSAGAAAGTVEAPVLLVPGDKQHVSEQFDQYLASVRVKKVLISGGTGAVSGSIETELKKRHQVLRYAGADRYDTSAKIAKDFHTKQGSVYLAYGMNFPDALAGAVVAGSAGAPLMLAKQACLPVSVTPVIEQVQPKRAVLLGGTGALGAGVAQGKGCS